MSKKKTLKKIEKKAYKSIFQDGLWEIFYGMLFLGIGITNFSPFIGLLPEPFDSLLVTLSWNILAVLIFFFGKRYITTPRMGIVKFGPKRKAQNRRLKFFLLFMVLANIIVLIFTLNRYFPRINLEGYVLPLFIGLTFVTLPLCLVAYFMKFNRLYVIGIMGGLCFFFAEFLYPIVGSPLDGILSFGIIGMTIIAMGFVYLIRFLRNHPLPKDIPEMEVDKSD